MATLASSIHEWECCTCTLLNKAQDSVCVLCNTSRSLPIKNKNEYGSIIYRIEPFTINEMEEINKLLTTTDNSKYPIILYPSNDINHKRDRSTEIDTALLSSATYDRDYLMNIISPYFNTFCYGVVVQFHINLLNYYKKIEILPIFNDFKHMIDKQFHLIQTQYIANGHNIIIPSPNTHEISHNIDIYYMQKDKQCIFHTLGTHPNGLPPSYIAYIQHKMDALQAKHTIYPQAMDPVVVCNDDEDIYAHAFDDDDDKQIDFKTIQYSKNDPIEVFNEHKNVWIRGSFLGEYKDKDCIQYFVEIPDVLESKIISIDSKFVRYLQEIDASDSVDNKEDEKSSELLLKTTNDNDEYWENVNDFVFKEYIIDIIDAMPHLVTDNNLFLEKIGILGIKSSKSRARALRFIVQIKKENQINIQNNKQDTAQYVMQSVITKKAIYVHITERKHTFKCRYYCKQKEHQKEGIVLSSCQHLICCACFGKYINKCIQRRKVPKCRKCEEIFRIKDVEKYVENDSVKENILQIMYYAEDDTSTSSSHESYTESDSDSDSHQDTTDIDYNSESSLDYEDKMALKLNKNVNKNEIKEKVSNKKRNNHKKGLFYCCASECSGYIEIKSKRKRLNKKSFKCPECKAKNCIDCNVIHKAIKNKKIRKLECSQYQFLFANKFLHRWKKMEMKSLRCNALKQLKKHSKMVKLYKVKRNSAEWKEVVAHMQTVSGFNVIRIDRVQNSRLYKEYYKHCKRMILKKDITVNEMNVWHGTRTTEPSIVWKQSGFDVRFANVGGCIWFAVQNNYSMGGYQFRKPNGENQVFLSFVACGDYESVKFIRNGQILNVYNNQSMYPAYLVTYRGNM